ncbi:TRAP transporter small permease [Pusillimonas sp.]|uniref:TRAP transporter small permease n=1 Tax=Pusillimonas sp. TaxID=3040095 RepID=UPI0029AEC33D|nr:TRAP transporter small permease [Pusillimonas sp.]MDX3895565.1 TRAP transporter small permease [Pusillimonas sp.]
MPGNALSPTNLLERINHCIMLFGSLLLGLMVVHTTLDVIMTYVMRQPFEGTVEIVSRYYMVAVVFLPLAFIQASDKHIVAELLAERLSKRMQLLCQCLTWILMAAFGLALAWQCSLEAMRMTAINEQFQTSTYFIPTWPSRWIPVFAGALIFAQALVSLAKDLMRVKNGNDGGSHVRQDADAHHAEDAASRSPATTLDTSI